MQFVLPSLTALAGPAALGIDEIIDVRSPSEHALDHLPGAVNLPVLNDAERAEVGTVYVQQSRFLARRMGAALVARNAAAHLEGYLAQKGPRYRPLVYCWRGGQRSGSFATILRQIGWHVRVLEGGYRSYRRLVNDALYGAGFPAPLAVLDGNTGTAKTALLGLLAGRGVQVIDLEGLARHRGSLFGAMPGGQPGQRAFESALAMAMARLDPSRPVVVEAESNRIGSILLPPTLWRAMQSAPRLHVSAPLAARAAYLTQAYAELSADADALRGRVLALAPYHSRETVAEWLAQAEAGAFEALAAGLMKAHYDPRYVKSRARHGGVPGPELVAQRLDAPGLERLAGQLEAALADMFSAR